MIEERNGAGVLQKQYIRGSVFQMQTSGGVFWLHEGANGSIAAVTDDTGTVVEAYQYGAYGQTTVTLGTGSLNDYRYLGVRVDVETSFYTGDGGGAYLSTTLGQFMTRDGANGWSTSGGLGNGVCFNGNDGVNAFADSRVPPGSILVKPGPFTAGPISTVDTWTSDYRQVVNVFIANPGGWFWGPANANGVRIMFRAYPLDSSTPYR